jgi:SnoaL-like domain
MNQIRDVVEGWAVWRDAGVWDRLLTTWHSNGRMHTTWFRGGAAEFVEACRRGFEAGAQVQHSLGGSVVDVRETRAVAHTKVTIGQRLSVDGVTCDVTGTGRFYDFFERREGEWRIVLRQPIYDKDRIDPVNPLERPNLDRELLDTFPPGCRHMLYAQHRNGIPIMENLPELRGPIVAALYAAGRNWMDGGPLDW